MEDESLDIVACGGQAEDAASFLVGGLDVLESPGCPQPFHAAILYEFSSEGGVSWASASCFWLRCPGSCSSGRAVRERRRRPSRMRRATLSAARPTSRKWSSRTTSTATSRLP